MLKKTGLVVLVVVMLVVGLAIPVYAAEDIPPQQGDMITKLAEAVGMSREEFLEELLSGKTTQEILAENGVSQQALSLMRNENQRQPTERVAITALTELLAMSRAEFYQALVDGYTLDALLEAEGLTHDDFSEAYKILAEENVNQALEDGKITEEQAEKMLDKLSDDDLGEQWLRRMDRKQIEQLMKRVQNFASAERIAPILGMDAAELKQALRGGDTLANVIENQGMDEQNVLGNLIAEAIEQVETALAEGKITADQAERILERMESEDFGQVAWQRILTTSFTPRDVSARETLNKMHALVEKFHNKFGH